MVSMVIVTRMLSQGLGAEEFGAYSLARRLLSMSIPFSTLVMGVAMLRYIAFSKDNNSKNNYFLSGLILVIVTGFILVIIGIIFKHQLSQLIYHNKKYLPLFMATLFMLIGFSFFDILYAYYRGCGKILYANLWQICVMSLGPIIIAWKYSSSGRVDIIIFLMGILLFTSFIPIIFHTIKAVIMARREGFKIGENIKELFQYGLPRTPGGLALEGIITIGPFLAPYFGSIKDAGYLAVGQSLLKVAESGMVAFNIVALPKFAQLLGEGRNNFIKEKVTDIMSLCFHIGLFATIHLFLWLDEIVLLWLGPQYINIIPLMKVTVIAIIPYLSYVMLRQVLNAIEKRPLNTINCLFSFVIVLIFSFGLSLLGFGVMGLAIGLVIGYFALGLLTIGYLFRLYRFEIKTFRIKEIILLNFILLLIGYSFKYFFVKLYLGLSIAIVSALIFESILFIMYLLALKKINVRWIFEVERRFFSYAS